MSTTMNPHGFPVALPGAKAETLMWANVHEVEPAALTQLRNISALPWVHGVRVMPDVHLGKGATVGSVVAMKQAVSPSAVGVDIGCGMMAVKTDVTLADLPDDLGALRSAIEAAVPVGFNANDGTAPVIKRDQRLAVAFDRLFTGFRDLRAEKIADREGRALSQCGSLGGGNHFIEVTVDDAETVWLMLHSGSRNIGKELAERHIAKAKGLDHNLDLPDRDLAVFLAGTDGMADYLHDLYWAQDYAMLNRRVMMATVKRVFSSFLADATYTDEINCFAGETEVLTQTGTFPIRDLAGGEHLLLTTGGEWVKAPVQSFGQQRLWEVTVGRFGQERVIRATENHRWLLRPKEKHNRIEAVTAELRVGDRLAYAFPQRPARMTPSREGVARGFVFGDGTTAKDLSYAIFCGEKDDALLPYFTEYGAPRSYFYTNVAGRSRYVKKAEVSDLISSGVECHEVKRVRGLPGAWKTEYPSLDSDPDALYGWLAGYFAADGDVGATGRPSINSGRLADVEFFKQACDVLGIWTHDIRVRTGSGYIPDARSYSMGIARADLDEAFFVLDEHRRRWLSGRGAVERRGWTVRSVTETDAVEEVYCAVVPETHAFTLAGNILTGNCHHNYVSEETYDGEDLIVTRKGAISAQSGQYGLIPGSMGTGSFVVKGLGNETGYCSASHGAGRKMSRSKAKKTFTVEDLAAQTAGVECRKDAGVVDEIPGAYKDLQSVIDAQVDLVEVEARLTTLLCVKG